MTTRPLVLIGAGMQAEEASYYFGSVGGRTIAAHVVDPEYLQGDGFQGRPLIGFEEACRRFPPSTHDGFVAIGMLATGARRRWFLALREAGYQVPSFVHPTAVVAANVPVLAGTFIKETAVVSGAAHIGERCFIGTGATVRDRVQVGDGCVIGAGALIMENCPPNGVYRGHATHRTRTLED